MSERLRTGDTCSTCRSWHHTVDTFTFTDHALGECRRLAPRVVVIEKDGEGEAVTLFPTTEAACWCDGHTPALEHNPATGMVVPATARHGPVR